MSQMQNNSIFWIETEKIKPNPYQPRREFNEEKLNYLAESIRQYGILQPLVATRKEVETSSGIDVFYELIAGERRLRASKIAGLVQVPIIIREEQDENIKLELAIIENLQREDLNPVDKARAFKKLVDEFKFKHHEIGTKVGKSREYVTNIIRMLNLPDDMLDSLARGEINEGHTRPLLMLSDRPDEQVKMFKQITLKKMSIREAELTSRRIAQDRARQKENLPDPETREIEDRLSDDLGTRVEIQKIGDRGKIVINFFSQEELESLLARVRGKPFDERNMGIVEDTTPAESCPLEDEEEIIGRFTV